MLKWSEYRQIVNTNLKRRNCQLVLLMEHDADLSPKSTILESDQQLKNIHGSSSSSLMDDEM